MKAIGYVRVPAVGQAESGLGLQAQRDRIEAYCKLRGLNLVDLISDNGDSASMPLAARPGGIKLMQALTGRRHKADAVVMLKLDRGFGNVSDCVATVEQWAENGIRLHVIDLGGAAVDTGSAEGKFMLTVLAGAAAMERSLLREQAQETSDVMPSKEERQDSRVPFGYDVNPDGVSLRRNAVEQAIVAEMRRLSAGGATLQEIADELTKRGIDSKRGGRWHAEAVDSILNRTVPSA